VTAVLSNLVSNVPAVLMMKPFVEHLPDHRHCMVDHRAGIHSGGQFHDSWLHRANLIVVQKAAARGVEISFWAYFRVGAPLTIITLVIGTLWMWL
jgi:Na+/H+ antiporter NhaD/arsenite permease-like protein